LSYEASVTPIYNENKVNGSIIIIRNMTTEKAAENQLLLQAQQLQELNHLKDKLFTVIAHDLRSPFAGMKSALELTETGVIEKDEFFELIPQLLKQVKEVSELLDNLFSWSSMQLAGKDFKKDTIKLLDFTKTTLEVFRRRAESKGISLEYEIAPELEIKFDVGSLELIYRNLISNAIKFCSSGDIITVMAEQSGDKIILFFVDSGVGIPEHIQTQLFTSIGATTPGTHMERGSGFGLAICHEYAVKNGASLSVKSEVGTGSIFSLEVPISSEEKKQSDCKKPECLPI
jgi:signal transduction histidine kinase